MSKDGLLEMEGKILQVLPNQIFKKLQINKNKNSNKKKNTKKMGWQPFISK